MWNKCIIIPGINMVIEYRKFSKILNFLKLGKSRKEMIQSYKVAKEAKWTCTTNKTNIYIYI